MKWLWKTCFGVALVLGLLGTLFAGPAQARSFGDVDSSDWFAPAVDQLSNLGVVAGYPDGGFHPGDLITRGQFAAMLAAVIAPPQSFASPFADIGPSDQYYGAVASLYGAGLIVGTTPTTFSPNATVERAQAASLVIRALAYRLAREPVPGVSVVLTQAEVQAWLGGFRDRWLVSSPHDVNVAAAARLGIITGQPDGRFYPLLSLTRAQAAGIVYRAFYTPLSPQTYPPAAVPAEEGYGTLSMGATGPLVLLLEQRLAAMKYQVGQVDGTFDGWTKAAVTAFQKAEGLKRTGECGAEVWMTLGSARTVTPRYHKSGMRAEVDLTRQVLILLSGDTVLKVLDCSTGMPGLETPTGHFRITWKVGGWRHGMYLPSYFCGGCAIHGGYTVHVYPSSHGCVRIHNWDADGIYGQLPVGTPVDVYY